MRYSIEISKNMETDYNVEGFKYKNVPTNQEKIDLEYDGKYFIPIFKDEGFDEIN